MKHSYANHVRAYEKSVVLGGARELFPVDPSVTQAFARQIQMTIAAAEELAFERGRRTAQAEMQAALGLA